MQEEMAQSKKDKKKNNKIKKNGGRDAVYILLLVNLWAQVRSQGFLAKAVSQHLLYISVVSCEAEKKY
jgi:hypothetical protein